MADLRGLPVISFRTQVDPRLISLGEEADQPFPTFMSATAQTL